MLVCFSKRKAVALTSALTLCLIIMTINRLTDAPTHRQPNFRNHLKAPNSDTGQFTGGALDKKHNDINRYV